MSNPIAKIHKIVLPTGFPIGDVNVYLIKDDPVTLIDTGVNGAISEHILSRELKALGLSFPDIKRIIITHAHLDHCGMAGTLQELSGAEILIHTSKVKEVENFSENFLKGPRILKNFWLESAVPEPLYARSLRSYHKSIYMASRVDNAVGLRDGDIVASENFRFKIIHAPGHSSDMICLYEEEIALLFSSDHITLQTIPSLRLKEIFAQKNGELGNMHDYLDSLDKVEKLYVRTTMPGHGDSFGEPLDAIKEIRKIYVNRRKLVAKILSRGFLSRFELSRALFGFLNDREIFKGIPEISGHLELLDTEGRLAKFNQNGIMYYSLKQ